MKERETMIASASFAAGWDAALDAAREAVKRLPERYADGGRSLWEVLSAIDALREVGK